MEQDATNKRVLAYLDRQYADTIKQLHRKLFGVSTTAKYIGLSYIAATPTTQLRSLVESAITKTANSPFESPLMKSVLNQLQILLNESTTNDLVTQMATVSLSEDREVIIPAFPEATVSTVVTSCVGPSGIIYDSANGRIIFSDTESHTIYALANDETLSIIAGCQQRGHLDGNCANAKFNSPIGLAVTKDGNTIYVADKGNHCIRKIANGTVSTLCGVPGKPGNDDSIDFLRYGARYIEIQTALML